MANLNRVELIGRLTREVQVKYTTGGTAVAEIGIAVNRRYLDKQSNQWKDDTTFIDGITLWGKQAEFAGEHLSKGREVYIEGRLQLDQWEDRETGTKRSKLKIVCENIQALGGKSDQRTDTRQEQPTERNQAPASEPEYTGAVDEVPF